MNRNIWALTALTMMAFAANSILTRLAVDGAHSDPAGFAIMRVLAGAIVLASLVLMRGGTLPVLRGQTFFGALSLTLYMVGFSLAYVSLDAGIGALILFGITQLTMFGYGWAKGTALSSRQMLGTALAFVGLVVVLWSEPGSHAELKGAGWMAAAGLGWGAYSILGAKAENPLQATAGNFVLCLPILLVLLSGFVEKFTPTGIVLAFICGGATSGLGYATWYSVLPVLGTARAAIIQLSVPIIAIAAGALLLGETITVLTILATLLVVGGIGFAITARRETKV